MKVALTLCFCAAVSVCWILLRMPLAALVFISTRTSAYSTVFLGRNGDLSKPKQRVRFCMFRKATLRRSTLLTQTLELLIIPLEAADPAP